ncbi:MAG: hypothetical protein AAFZ63_29510 [Bacteroidota bacterium]
MSKLYSTLFLLNFVFLSTTIGQITPDNAENLFIVNQTIYDVNTLEPAWSENISSKFTIKFEEQDILGVNSGSRLLFFDNKGVATGDITLPRGAYVSPNLDYVLTSSEQDFWIQDIVDFKGLSEARRLTQLGNISNFRIDHWSGNMLYFSLYVDRYILNISTKEISRFNGDSDDLPKENLYYNPSGSISPNGKYGLSKYYPETRKESVITEFEGHAVYNFNSGEHIQYPPVTDEFGILNTAPVWISPNSFFVFVTSAKETSSLSNQLLGWKGQFKEDGNIEILKGYNTPFQGVQSKVDFLTHFDGRSRCVSPDGKYSLFFVDEKLAGGGRSIKLLNLDTEEFQVLFSNSNEEDFEKNSMVSTWSTPASFRWISSTEFIYTTDGDLLTQGTWVFDVETKQKRKVSSFVAQKFLVFEDANYVLFSANGKLFRLGMNDDSTAEDTQIPTVNQYSKLFKLVREFKLCS